ncbi:MAG: cadherin domain-containing protein, partial [Gemmataceae bacterium]
MKNRLRPRLVLRCLELEDRITPAPITFVVDPIESTVGVSGQAVVDIPGFPVLTLNSIQQAPGSTLTRFSGEVSADYDPTLDTITFFNRAIDVNDITGGNLSAIDWTDGIVTVTTVIPHRFEVGETVTITGFDPTGYNGTYTVLAKPTPFTFTYELAVDPGLATTLGNATTATAERLIGENAVDLGGSELVLSPGTAPGNIGVRLSAGILGNVPLVVRDLEGIIRSGTQTVTSVGTGIDSFASGQVVNIIGGTASAGEGTGLVGSALSETFDIGLGNEFAVNNRSTEPGTITSLGNDQYRLTVPYVFQIFATLDQLGGTIVLDLTLEGQIEGVGTLQANEKPLIISNGGGDSATVPVPEGTSLVTTVQATDADGQTPTYAIVGGRDRDFFTIDATTGELSFLATPDFETRQDIGRGNDYEVFVTASDGTLFGEDEQRIIVTVTDVAPVGPEVNADFFGTGPATPITITEAELLANDTEEVIQFYFEDFEGIALDSFETPILGGGDGTDWGRPITGVDGDVQRTLPTLNSTWVRTNTDDGLPTGNQTLFNLGESPPEYYGWNVLDIDSWSSQQQPSQRRTDFAKGGVGSNGTVLVAEADGYDDVTDIDPDGEEFNTFGETLVSWTGAKPGSLVLEFDSSFKPNNPQLGITEISYGDLSISSISFLTDTVTVETTTDHGLSVGDTVDILGVSPSGYNGTFIVTGTPSTTQFTYALATDPGLATVLGTVTPWVNLLTLNEATGGGSGSFARANETVTIPLTPPPAEAVTGNARLRFSLQNAKNDAWWAIDNVTVFGKQDIVGPATDAQLVPASEIGGTVMDNGDGTFTFTPTVGFSGTASFQYQDVAGTVPTTVFIEVEGIPPVLEAILDNDGDNRVQPNTEILYTFLFNEDIDDTTFDDTDLDNAIVAGANFTVDSITETDVGVFTVAVTPTTEGDLQLQIASGATITDVSGNELVTPVADNNILVVDGTGPEIMPVDFVDDVSPGSVVQGRLVTYTLTFNEDMSGGSVEAADFENAAPTTPATIEVVSIEETTPGVFTVVVRPTSAGNLQLGIATGATITDAVGNLLVPPVADDTTITVTGDAVPPTVISIVDDGQPIGPDRPIVFTVTFSEDINDETFLNADLSNAAGSNPANIDFENESLIEEVSPGVFEITVTPVNNNGGNLVLAINPGFIEDLAGNVLAVQGVDDTTIVIPADNTPPDINNSDFVDNVSGGPITVGEIVTYTVTFNEDIDETTFNPSDLRNDGSASITVLSITETATPGEFLVNVAANSTGSLRLEIVTGFLFGGATILDVAGNALPTNLSQVYTDDTTITVNSVSINVANDVGGGPVDTFDVVTYTINFNEDIRDGSLNPSDLANAGTSEITVRDIVETAPGVFDIEVVPTTVGTLQLQIPSGATVLRPSLSSLATPLTDSVVITVNADTTAPTTTPVAFVDDVAGGPVPVNTRIPYTLTFSEDIANQGSGTLVASDFGNDGTSSFEVGTIRETGQGTFEVDIIPTSAGTLILSLPAGADVQDLAGNALVTPVADNTTIIVGAIYDLEVLKDVDQPTVTVGQNVIFTVTVNNLGPDATNGVVITDLLPAEFTFVSASPSEGSYDANTGLWTGIDLDFPTDATATLTITATANAAGTPTNTAMLTDDGTATDNNAANDTDSEQVTINDAAQSLQVTNVSLIGDGGSASGFKVDFNLPLTTDAIKLYEVGLGSVNSPIQVVGPTGDFGLGSDELDFSLIFDDDNEGFSLMFQGPTGGTPAATPQAFGLLPAGNYALTLLSSSTDTAFVAPSLTAP